VREILRVLNVTQCNARFANEELARAVCAILKRDGKDVVDMTAMDRLAELHANEALLKRLADLNNCSSIVPS
jgi:hypothetical protein